MTRSHLRLAALLSLILAACKPTGGERYTRQEAQQSLRKLEAPGLLLGEFRLSKVVDGDTIKVDGLDASLRLLGVDAEETFKSEADRRAVEASWEGYLKAKRGESKHPVKFATPLGEAAKDWAKQWFAGVTRVRIERDDAAEIRDRYDRYLSYVLAEKDGAWRNYNIELVRAGLSPYFPKYGRSRRFHQELLAAEAEAKAAHRGIWHPGALAYPDYPEREAWWAARGDFVEAFRREAEGKPSYIDITHVDAAVRLEEQLGKEVHVLGAIDDVIRGRGPARVMLSRGRSVDFPLIFFDPDVLAMSGADAWRGEFVVVTGVPTFYENKHTHKKQLQIVVDRASQLRLSPVPGLSPLSPAAPAAAAAGADP
ncbi:MAG TPA: thermonuclease family protein [Kofleriaceae bacterium]|nr:thermonuclease family protein [Kofleriaceae bacterium]